MVFNQEHSSILKKQTDIVKIKQDIKREKRRLHKEYVAENKRALMIMDFAMVCVIMFNLGALVMTNLLVVQVEPTKGFVEANQAQCNWNGFSCAEENNGAKLVYSLLKQSFLWTIMIFAYLVRRSKVYTDEGFYLMFFIVTFYFWMTNIDFVHDVGLYIGKVMFGV